MTKNIGITMKDITVKEVLNTLDGEPLNAFVLFLRDSGEFISVRDDKTVWDLYHRLATRLNTEKDKIYKMSLVRLTVEALGWVLKFTDEFRR